MDQGAPGDIGLSDLLAGKRKLQDRDLRLELRIMEEMGLVEIDGGEWRMSRAEPSCSLTKPGVEMALAVVTRLSHEGLERLGSIGDTVGGAVRPA